MSLRHALLGLLAERPSSGYDLLKVFEISLAHVWPATQSQLYTELNKLADVDLIRVASTGARGRKDYEITDEGRAELHRWLVEPAAADSGRRNADLLRVFFLGSLSKREGRALLSQLRDRYAASLAELQAIADEVDGAEVDFDRFGRIALECGLRVTTTLVEWTEWSLGELDRAGGRPRR